MNTIFSSLHLKYSALIICVLSIFSISGGGDDDSYWVKYNSTFTPEAFVTDTSYEPLFYSNNMFYDFVDWRK